VDVRPRVTVIGGGISGLATAYFLGKLDVGTPPAVTLIETDRRLGGKIHTRSFAGRQVDTGPDSFLSRAADLRQLIADLGLTDAVVAPLARNAYVLSRGKLRPLPQGAVFGIPQHPLPLLRSGLLSPLGVVRAGADLILPRTRLPKDPSVKQLLRARFGTQVYNRLVEPLLGGVHAGRAHLLSAASAVPEIDALAKDSRSIYLSLRRRAAAAPRRTPGQPAPAALTSIDGGLGRMVDALATALADATVLTGRSATSIEWTDPGFRVGLDGGESVPTDVLVLATPAYVTARLLSDVAPGASAALHEVQHANIANVTMEYRPEAIGRPLNGSGFLVPPEEGCLLVGCTWLSAKWQHLATGDTVLIRCSVGRHGDNRWTTMDDDTLVNAVHAELAPLLQLSRGPVHANIQRWPNGLPQYTVGHADRVARVETAIGEVPGLFVTGAAYRGVGLAACVSQARKTATTVLTRLQQLTPVAPPAKGGPTQEVLP
jgi:protoporphyrinogen/coproporphyrinogen III oxidase